MPAVEKGLIFNTGPYGDPPPHLKNQNFEEPRLHNPGTFGGFGKREQTDIQDSCFISIDL
jgi:hypothetical protein